MLSLAASATRAEKSAGHRTKITSSNFVRIAFFPLAISNTGQARRPNSDNHLPIGRPNCPKWANFIPQLDKQTEPWFWPQLDCGKFI
jgi:hypothetical protein